jgi:isoleucyl-tRNA synthetase
VLLTYWNTASFFVLYANAAGWHPDDGPATTDPAARPVLDRWALAELAATADEVDDALAAFDSLRAGRRLARFIDDLSNWYVRRSRRRFWAGDPDALATLYTCLDGLTRAMAPVTPFLTDWLWARLFAGRRPDHPDSVHLSSWPTFPAEWRAPELSAQMDLVRRIVELGRAARASSGVRTRQPLPRAVVGASAFDGLPAELRAQVAEELNVTSVEAATADVVDVTVKPNFRALGRRFGKRTPAVARAMGQAGLPVDGRLTVELDGERIELAGDELIVTETPREGWAVTSESGLSVALDLAVTPALARAGLARDIIRILQDARKAAGLEITDRIEVWWSADREETVVALHEHGATVAGEVLAVAFREGDLPAGVRHTAGDLGLTFSLAKTAAPR